MVFAAILIAAAVSASGAASLPDTTKATVIDDLSVLGSSGDIATPDYLFGTVVTNEMYDATGTN